MTRVKECGKAHCWLSRSIISSENLHGAMENYSALKINEHAFSPCKSMEQPSTLLLMKEANLQRLHIVRCQSMWHPGKDRKMETGRTVDARM
jgi:hypothetical protein